MSVRLNFCELSCILFDMWRGISMGQCLSQKNNVGFFDQRDRSSIDWETMSTLCGLIKPLLSSTMTIFVRRREIISRSLTQSIHFHFYQKNDEAFPPVSFASQSTKNQIIEPIKSRVSSVQSDQNCDELRLLLLHWWWWWRPLPHWEKTKFIYEQSDKDLCDRANLPKKSYKRVSSICWPFLSFKNVLCCCKIT